MLVTVISPTVQEFNGERYYLCGKYFQRRGRRLHIAVWESLHGAVPAGCHVHHVDHDRANNEPENLELLIAHDHLAGHMKEPERMTYAREHIKDMQEQAKAWHSTEAGKEWHAEHSRAIWRATDPVEYTCDHCGKVFRSRKRYAEGAAKFCGPNCKAAHRRASGVDNEERTCAVCGKIFTANRYSAVKYCSPECRKAGAVAC